MLKKQLVLERTSKNLFLMDVNQLWEPTATACLTTSVGPDVVQNHAAEKPCRVVHLGDQLEGKGSEPSCHVMSQGIPGATRLSTDTHDHAQVSQGNREKSDLSSSEPCDRVPSCNSNDVQGCFLGRSMDRIYPHQVRKERQAGAQDVCSIRVPTNEARPDSGGKECQRGPQDPVRASDSPFRCVDRAPRPGAHEHDLMPPSRTCGGHGNAAPGEPELGTSHGSGRNDDAGSAGPSPSLLCEDRELSFLTDAEAQILNDLAFCEQQLLNAQVDMDYDFQPEVIHHSFHRTCQRFTKQFQAEFHAVARKLQGKRYQIQTPKLDVLEIIFFRK